MRMPPNFSYEDTPMTIEQTELNYFAVEDQYGRTHIFNQHTDPRHFDNLKEGRGYKLSDDITPEQANTAMMTWSLGHEHAVLHWQTGVRYGNCNDMSERQLLRAAEDGRLD